MSPAARRLERRYRRLLARFAPCDAAKILYARVPTWSRPVWGTCGDCGPDPRRCVNRGRYDHALPWPGIRQQPHHLEKP